MSDQAGNDPGQWAPPGGQPAPPPPAPAAQPQQPPAQQPEHQPPATPDHWGDPTQPQQPYPQQPYPQQPYQPQAPAQAPLPGYQQPQQPGQWDATQHVTPPPPPAPGQWTQTPPPPPPPGAPDPYGHQPAVQQSSVKTGLPIGRLGLIATVVLLAGLGGFAVWRALSAPGGAATPEEAAAEVFEAADSEDLLGIVEAMLPSEREAMVEPMTDIMIELARLDVLSDEAINGDQVNADVSGLSFDIPAEGEPGALVYDVEPLGTSENIQWVTVTDGLLTATFDPDQARELLGDRLGDLVDEMDTSSGGGLETETVDLGEEYRNGEPLQFAVVEEDGSWYFSLWYTVAGFATDFEEPDLGRALNPIGADSGEAAAAQFLQDLIVLDITGAMTMLDPEEFRAAYDYWGEFGPELADGASALRDDALAEGFTWEVVSIGADSEERNGRTVATIDEMTMGFTSTQVGSEADLIVGISADGLVVDGTIQGQPIQATIDTERATASGVIDGQVFELDVDLATYEGFAQVGPDRFDMSRVGDCLLVTINNEETEEVCGDDFGGSDPFASLEFQQEYQETFAEIGTPGFTVVERDGRWYVSGFPTYAYGVVDFLKVIEPEEFDELLDSYEELLEGVGGDFDL
ncbi:MAG: hypothetical protein AAFO29_01595 [Actinomycetota bacterium]